MGRRQCSDRDLLRSVGGEITLRRRARGMSQEELAEVCGLHRNSLGRIERGECDTSITALSYLYFQLACKGVRIDSRCVVPFPDESPGESRAAPPSGMRPATMVRILASVVHSRRMAMDMSLQSASRESTIHLNTLWSFEQGLVCPTITTYFRLLRTLGVNAVTQDGGTPRFF